MIPELLIVVFICFARCIAQQLPIIPGVDNLQSGYDGTKMLSASEQRSRYRIFDLNDLSSTPFVVKALGKERRYATPAIVQVTDVSTRSERSCEAVSYSFEEFYHRYCSFSWISLPNADYSSPVRSYFQSNSFSLGVTTFKGSFGLEYHETLKKVYEAITKRSQVVGTSTIWWGLYSIQLPPSYVLK